MGLVKQDDGWRLPDESWAKMVPLLPPRPEHPLGCHNPRVPDRQAMDAILLVLRTGMQWQALKATGVCHPSSAYRRFRDWVDAGVFRGRGVVPVDAAEPWAANVLHVGGSVCVGAAFPRTAEMLAGRGYDVRAVDVSEFAKAEGGLTCMSLLFRQP